MIKLSTKGRYGSRLMLNLAHNYKNGKTPVILKNIAEDEEISIRYLEQIIIALKTKGLVKSVRGAGGGYILAKAPSELKLIDIIEAMEGVISLVDCVDDDTYCHRIPECATHEIWKEISLMLREYLDKISLADLNEILMRKKNHPAPRA